MLKSGRKMKIINWIIKIAAKFVQLIFDIFAVIGIGITYIICWIMYIGREDES